MRARVMISVFGSLLLATTVSSVSAQEPRLARLADPARGQVDALLETARTERLPAEPLVDRFVEFVRGHGIPTQTGKFGAHMEVEIHNDGPVTIWLER